VTNTQLIQITVSDSNPKQAAQIANAFAKEFEARIGTLSSERFAASIKNAQERVNFLQTKIGDLDRMIEDLHAKKVEKDIALANEQSKLDELRKDDQALQESSRQIQQSLAEATGKVYVFEPVQVKESRGVGTASAVISTGQIQTSSGIITSKSNQTSTYGQLLLNTSILESVIKEPTSSLQKFLLSL
jgi:chromosome segregation ATPase